ncbi:T9SS type A sorting domain-containing protein [Psychroserpens burtonensis]|uniref:T9SS type A sorting domain-containing protein n=2 Tax=Psychroserpens burtonensis TaxID=49278 RepID=A0A5C7B8P0_9FLAO|nr:T9SS type A sorting domain-containing protein [Psychroserpens burtonensis]
MMKLTLLVLCAVLIALGTSAQALIKGAVSDDLGQLPLAHITIKNSKTGTSSNDDGKFLIEANPTDILQFSYLGYKTKEVLVGELTTIDMVFDSYEELDSVLIYAHTGAISCTTVSCYLICGCGRPGVSAIQDASVRKSESEIIKLYPNPSKDGIFKIKLLEDVSEVNIMGADITGRILLNGTEGKLRSNIIVDLSSPSSGIYIISVSSNGVRIAAKRVIRM